MTTTLKEIEEKEQKKWLQSFGTEVFKNGIIGKLDGITTDDLPEK